MTVASSRRCSRLVLPILAALLLVGLAGTAAAQTVDAPLYQFTTMAAPMPADSKYGASDGVGLTARFTGLAGLVLDSAGNTYVADRLNHTIRKIAPDGTVTTFAGSAGYAGAADGTGTAARFRYPGGIAVDAADNLYVADTYNHTIRMITPAGVVTTLAGSPQQSGSADGTGAAARFNQPNGLAVAPSGTIYVADTNNHTVRAVTAAGVVTTLAGAVGQWGYVDGTGSAARMNLPVGVAVDSAGNIYVSDYYTIRKITAGGVVTNFAGANYQPVTGFPRRQSSYYDGTGAGAMFNHPNGLAVDGSGNVYVADESNHAIRKISPAGVVTILAGSPPVDTYFESGRIGNSYFQFVPVPGYVDGIGLAAKFQNPRGLAIDGTGTLHVADAYNSSIRHISPAGDVTTFVGAPSTLTNSPNPAFATPSGMARDAASGALYVADNNRHVIRKIMPDGTITVFAGVDGQYGSTDGLGSSARFNQPRALAVDTAGNVYVADWGNRTVRKITAAGLVTTLAGSPLQFGNADGAGPAARFYQVTGVAVDAAGTVYVCDYEALRICRITPAGVVTTLWGPYLYGNERPLGLGVDPEGNIHVAVRHLPSQGTLIAKITPAGLNAMGAILPIPAYSQGYMVNLTVDRGGNAYIVDGAGQSIYRISPAGVVTKSETIDGASAVTADPLIGGMFNHNVANIAVDDNGTIYTTNGRNEVVTGQLLNPAVAIVQQPSSLTVGAGLPLAFTVVGSGNGPLTYQWARDGVPIPGATSSAHIIPRASAGVAGTYTVTVSLENIQVTSAAALLTVVPWVPAQPGRADLNGDGKADLLWENLKTRERAIWFMDGTNFLGASTLGIFEPDWSIAATGDFNNDGMTDIVWSSNDIGERAVWLMNGPFLLGISTFGNFPLEWTIAATGDFDQDGKIDLVWSNSATGERALWLMDGVSFKASSTLGIFPREWTVAATGDFNYDGKPDIVWSNSVTGERALWMMNGTNLLAVSTLGLFPLEWTVEGTADFNGDGKTDLIWSNSVTGERALWLMDGTQFIAASTLGIFPLEWTVGN